MNKAHIALAPAIRWEWGGDHDTANRIHTQFAADNAIYSQEHNPGCPAGHANTAGGA